MPLPFPYSNIYDLRGESQYTEKWFCFLVLTTHDSQSSTEHSHVAKIEWRLKQAVHPGEKLVHANHWYQLHKRRSSQAITIFSGLKV